MWPDLEIDFSVDERCYLYLDWTYFDYVRADQRTPAAEEKRQQRERDKDRFLSEFYADYDWGPCPWNHPEHTAQRLIWLLEECDMLDGRKRPKGNAELEALLKEAVEQERLIVEIVSDGGGIYAPLGNPASAGSDSDGILAAVETFEPFRSATLNSDEPILSGPYDPATQEARRNAARGISSAARVSSNVSHWDLPGAVEAAAAMLGGNVHLAADADESALDDDFASGTGDGSTSLGDAQAFEYQPGMPDGDVDELAGMPFNGEPGTWISSMPGTMPQMRQYGPNGTPLTDFDFEAHHGNSNPHAHNWDGYNRDEGAPVSLLPW